jgi:hypothetical protein
MNLIFFVDLELRDPSHIKKRIEMRKNNEKLKYIYEMNFTQMYSLVKFKKELDARRLEYTIVCVYWFRNSHP